MDTKILDVIVGLDDYYATKMPKARIDTYLRTLEDINPDALAWAADEWVKAGKPFMPKVSELRVLASKFRVSDGRNYLTAEYVQLKDAYCHGADNLDELRAVAAKLKRADNMYMAEEAERFIEWASSGETTDTSKYIIGEFADFISH